MQEVGKDAFLKPITRLQATVNLIKNHQTQLPIKTRNQQLNKNPGFRQELAQMGKPRKADHGVEAPQVVIKEQVKEEPANGHQKVAKNPRKDKP